MRTVLIPILAALVLAAPRVVAQDAAVFTPEAPLTRFDLDVRALERHRPGFPFWQHIFTIPDGRIAFGSAQDGRLLAVFPTAGDWSRDAVWEDATLLVALEGRTLPKRVDQRREEVVRLLTPVAGPLVHNQTR
jgi:hypothetical protein